MRIQGTWLEKMLHGQSRKTRQEAKTRKEKMRNYNRIDLEMSDFKKNKEILNKRSCFGQKDSGCTNEDRMRVKIECLVWINILKK